MKSAIIEIILPSDREHQLEHLAGIAASELGLAAHRSIRAPTRALYTHTVEADELPELVLQLAFDDLPMALTADETRGLEEKIEGSKTKKDRRCRARVLVAHTGGEAT